MEKKKVLIKSIRDENNTFLFLTIFFAIGTFLYVIWANTITFFKGEGEMHGEYTYVEWYTEEFILILIPILIITILFGWMYWCSKNSEVIVMEDKVCGITVLGKRVELPMDSISAIGTSFCSGISISTASGIIRFSFIANNHAIMKVVGELLSERQIEKNKPIQTENPVLSPADEIKKYKELLDIGAITQEEYDEKKKHTNNSSASFYFYFLFLIFYFLFLPPFLYLDFSPKL